MDRFAIVLKSLIHKNRIIYFSIMILIFSAIILLVVNALVKRETPVDYQAIYKKYFYDHYTDSSCSVLFCDLTHDGNDEMIVLQMLEENLTPKNIRGPSLAVEAFKAAELTVLQIKSAKQVTELFKTCIAYQHSNWGQLYLYQDSSDHNTAYLLNYNPYTMGGASHYSYSVYYFSEKGTPIIFDGNQISFIMGEKEPLLNAENSAEVMSFKQTVQKYISGSKPLIVYYEDMNGEFLFNYFDSAPQSVFAE